MLSKVDARLITQSGLFFGTFSLKVGGKGLHRQVSKAEYKSIQQIQKTTPVLLWSVDGRHYWWFKDAVYREEQGMNPDQVYALIIAAEMEQRERFNRQVERAQAMVAQGPRDSTPQRGHISVEIKNYVFQRDGGQCVTCGSKIELQFDHIIPVKFGGSSEPENLQVLCGPCNRRKGATLG